MDSRRVIFSWLWLLAFLAAVSQSKLGLEAIPTPATVLFRIVENDPCDIHFFETLCTLDELTVPSKIWLRTSFEMRCLSSGFAKNIADFENQANHLISDVNRHDYDLLGICETIPRLVGLRDESCSWSVYMVIEHLRLHTDFLLKAMRSLIVANEATDPTPTLRYWQPEDVGDESLDRFQDSVWQYVGFANNLRESRQHRQSTGTIRHPIYGRLDLKRLSVYGTQHLRIHRRQIQKIIAQIGVV